MKIEMILNPSSGNGFGLYYAKKIKAEFAKNGILDVKIFISNSIEQTTNRFEKIKKQNIPLDAMIFLGGDGTLSVCIDKMLKSGLNLPIAIFPAGTVNDFSKCLGMTKNVKKFVEAILKNKTTKCDIALVNGFYTINVAAGGYFTHSANTYSRQAKKLFGKIAYYIKGLFSSFGMTPQRMKFTIDGKVYEEDVLMYLIINSASVGGFPKMGAKSVINDGYFDFCAIKYSRTSLFNTFFKILIGKHTNDKNIIYQKGKNFKVELADTIIENPITKNRKKLDTNKNFIHSDLDGNVGPSLPLEVQVISHAITFYTRK